jgi:hypothetical protein
MDGICFVTDPETGEPVRRAFTGLGWGEDSTVACQGLDEPRASRPE